MTTTILCRRTIGGALLPIDDAGREAVAHIGKDDIVSVEVRRPRNLGHHRKFFALINLIYENQTRYSSPDTLLSAIKVMLGHAELLVLKDGREVYIPRSISFASMDQTAFDKFWDATVKLVCEKVLPGVKRSDLEREIRDLVA